MIVRDPLNNNTKLHKNESPTGNRLQVEFTTDSSISGKGFKISFEDSESAKLHVPSLIPVILI